MANNRTGAVSQTASLGAVLVHYVGRVRMTCPVYLVCSRVTAELFGTEP